MERYTQIMVYVGKLYKIAGLAIVFITIAATVAITIGGYYSYRMLSYRPDLATRIYDRNGTLLYQIHGEKNRVWVPLEYMPSHLKKATIAMEDHRFYYHPGVDPIAMIRAAKSTLHDGELQGGSTLTQQYVKNAFLSPEKTISRKIKEAALATLLESIQTKDQILERYLNEVSYGGMNYGVETAAQYYFGKHVTDLSLAESAVLAALTKAPSTLSPTSNELETIQRQKLVLAKMEQYGFISAEEREGAGKEKLTFVLQTPPLKAPHFAMAIRQQLEDKYGKESVEGGGLEVQTSLDYGLQTFAESVVAEEVSKLKKMNVSNGAVVILDPKNGEILTMVGSKDYYDGEIDGKYNVVFGKRQPGSAFKPFVYALAFENGYSPNTVMLDVPTSYRDTVGIYQPVNYDGNWHGPVTIRQALGNSYNIPATRMLATLGVESLIKEARELGIDYIESKKAGLSLALGGYEMRPIDLAAAYGVLANQGRLQTPMSILKVTDVKGATIFRYESGGGKQVWSEEVTYLISDILADNQARSQAFGSNSLLNISKAKVAVKTGTSNEKRDNWAIGYTPNFVVAVWVGNNDHTPMRQIASGMTGATPIWRKITDRLLEIKGAQWYAKPDGLDMEEKVADQSMEWTDCGLVNFEEESEEKENGEGLIEEDEQLNQKCEGMRRMLVENRDGEEVEIEELSEERYQQFQTDPMKFIEENKDKLMADEKPTPIYVKEAIAMSDPLTEKYDAGQDTYLSGVPKEIEKMVAVSVVKEE